MGKNTSTQHLFDVRIRQMGNPVVMEGFSYNAQGDVTPDAGDNRRTRRMTQRMLRRERKI
ncbi:hypothetical protein L8Z36_003085 [Salmonella enterica]|uniref:Uncharacterized protein n=1 Tax=Salmonella enterica subsp. enterica serovar Panama TaxID=29472 RepID=A0A5U8JDB7_SALET|nr:hypothetical protein [Salmonella enterica]EBR7995101.1 hypothetical protein [Salmonella enterica subsp. enterica serovar Panama]ECG3787349.1 hypothetical protein [Salmonella enterica subsp. enterica serovar Florida]EDS7005245.1 hypothetical protein [Salmonella enterica subsp. diarizonae]EKC4130890.1 hypothetical protein [Salmonella enterica subsp. enterica]ASD85097.1 hypothetical protein LFZ16_01860 [Salmonella enterica subsp. enterica serovar India str. SA20085604]